MNDTSFDFRRPDEGTKKEVSSSAASESAEKVATGSVSYALHPLVVINISDHHTRVTAQRKDASVPLRVFGILLGEQTGRRVEIANSFEIKVTLNGAPCPISKHS